MFKHLTTTTKELTPELAREFRDMQASPTERALVERHVAHLRAKIVADQMIPFEWAYVIYKGVRIRINGQHSSNALCQLDAEGKFPVGAKVTINEYYAETLDDVVALFRQIDDRQSARTLTDIAGAYQGRVEALRSADRVAAKLAVEAIIWYNKYVEKVPTPEGDDKYSLFNDTIYHAFILWHASLGNRKSPEMRITSVVSAMYATFSVNPGAAKEFWTKVGVDLEFNDVHPAIVLTDWLREVRVTKGKKKRPGEYYQACLYAWNAYRRGVSLRSMRFTTKNFYKIEE
jgi:hypothetical protein